MSDANDRHDADRDERLELLVSLAAGGDASARDWDDLAALAERDPAVWRRVAELQRDQARLAEAVGALVAVADTVSLPGAAGPGSRGADPIGAPARHERAAWLGALLPWGGWGLAAAAIVFMMVVRNPLARNGRTGDVGPVASHVATPGADFGAMSPNRAMEFALQRFGEDNGTVLGVLPTKVLLDSSPAASGTRTIIYVTQILEQKTVPFYRIEPAEGGQSVLLPVRNVNE